MEKFWDRLYSNSQNFCGLFTILSWQSGVHNNVFIRVNTCTLLMSQEFEITSCMYVYVDFTFIKNTDQSLLVKDLNVQGSDDWYAVTFRKFCCPSLKILANLDHGPPFFKTVNMFHRKSFTVIT